MTDELFTMFIIPALTIPIIALVMSYIMVWRDPRNNDGWECSGTDTPTTKCKVCKALQINRNNRSFKIPVTLIFIGIGMVPLFGIWSAQFISGESMIVFMVFFVPVMIAMVAIGGTTEVLQSGRRF